MDNKILFVLIDDDEEDYEIFKMAIDQIGESVSCLHFPDCESALFHFSQKSVKAPNYVFIDLNLPRIDGDQCLQKLQELNEFDHPVITIYSTSIPDQWKPELERIGVDNFIEKSASLSTLTEQIRNLMQQK